MDKRRQSVDGARQRAVRREAKDAACSIGENRPQSMHGALRFKSEGCAAHEGRHVSSYLSEQ